MLRCTVRVCTVYRYTVLQLYKKNDWQKRQSTNRVTGPHPICVVGKYGYSVLHVRYKVHVQHCSCAVQYVNASVQLYYYSKLCTGIRAICSGRRARALTRARTTVKIRPICNFSLILKFPFTPRIYFTTQSDCEVSSKVTVLVSLRLILPLAGFCVAEKEARLFHSRGGEGRPLS